MKHYDLAILGTGSGNTILSDEMKTWKIAVVEPWTFGGTCLNRGCIPSKMFIHPADVALEAKEASSKYNVQAWFSEADFVGIRDRVFNRIDPIAVSGKEYRQSQPNIDVYTSKASFVGPKTLEVDGEQFTADKIVIAVGSTPTILPIPGIENVHVETSDTIMRMDKQPKSLTIIGGGAIAVEMAHVFNALGTQVNMVNRSDTLLSSGDREISIRLGEIFRDRGITMHCNKAVDRAWEDEKGKHLQVGGNTITSEAILMVAGRTSNAKTMNCEAAGVELDKEYKVVVNDYMESSVPGIYALGDVCSRDLDLKHIANAHARTIKHNLLHPDNQITPFIPNQPYVTFCQPEVGGVGLTEEQAKAQGLDYIVHKHNYGSAAYGWALEDTTSFIKLIVDRGSRKLLGAHLIGPQASLLMQILVMGMSFDLTVEDIAKKQIWPHPALSEVVEQVLLDVPAS